MGRQPVAEPRPIVAYLDDRVSSKEAESRERGGWRAECWWAGVDTDLFINCPSRAREALEGDSRSGFA